MSTRMLPRTRVTVSLSSDLVRRLDRQSRAQGASRSGLAERWLRAGERQAARLSLEEELERHYSQPPEIEEAELAAALGHAAREAAVTAVKPRRRSRRRQGR